MVKEAPASQAESGATDIELKKYIDSQGRPESSRGLASYRLTTVKSLLSSFFAVASGLLIVGRFIICAETFTEGARVSPETVTLKPGEYVWEPERAPEGPLLIVASITEQVAYVYRNGIRIARSSVSTGRPGHRTPAAYAAPPICTIPSRLPSPRNEKLAGIRCTGSPFDMISVTPRKIPSVPRVTMKGATVIIADEHSAPAETVHPGLFFTRSGEESEPIPAGQFEWNPDKSLSGPVSLIVSSADKTVYVYRNGVEIGRAAIANPQVVLPLNDHVFSALQSTDADGHLRWIQVTAKGKQGSSESLFLAAQKSGLPAEFLTKTTQVITPGTTIIFTDKPVDPTTQSHTGFQILVAQKDKPFGTAE